MKKLLFAPLILAGALSAFADSFTDAIQDLAVQTACIGKYNTHQTPNPLPPAEEEMLNKYKEWMMAERFAKMSGNMTRTTTVYGVCFDYAQFAYNDIEQYKDWYNKQGMYENKFWIAGVHGNSNEIQLQYPGTANYKDYEQNGVYVKYPYKGLRNVKTHRHNDGKGPRATGHAWLWIERADGVQFWVDPTWTDISGYVVYGYVSNGEEIQCRPDRDYCINYPEHLNSLPLPPPMGARKAASPSANSTNRNEIVNDSGTDWLSNAVSFFWSKSGKFKDNYNALMVSVNVPFSAFKDKSLSADKMAFSLEMPCLYNYAHIIGLEYLQNIGDDYSIRGGLLTLDFARRLTNNFALYLGGGVGLRFYPDNAPSNLASTSYFAFKGNTGLLFNISRVFTKVDFAYDNVMGFSVGLGMGFAFYHERGK